MMAARDFADDDDAHGSSSGSGSAYGSGDAYSGAYGGGSGAYSGYGGGSGYGSGSGSGSGGSSGFTSEFSNIETSSGEFAPDADESGGYDLRAGTASTHPTYRAPHDGHGHDTDTSHRPTSLLGIMVRRTSATIFMAKRVKPCAHVMVQVFLMARACVCVWGGRP